MLVALFVCVLPMLRVHCLYLDGLNIVEGLGNQAPGSGFQVYGLGFGVWGFGV
jgi:hypothetical protein